MNTDQLARSLYEAYCEHTAWKSLATGQALPQWVNLPQTIQQAWMAVARKAYTIKGLSA